MRSHIQTEAAMQVTEPTKKLCKASSWFRSAWKMKIELTEQFLPQYWNKLSRSSPLHPSKASSHHSSIIQSTERKKLPKINFKASDYLLVSSLENTDLSTLLQHPSSLNYNPVKTMQKDTKQEFHSSHSGHTFRNIICLSGDFEVVSRICIALGENWK